MATAPLPASEIDGDEAGQPDDLLEVHQRAMQRFDSVAVPQRQMRADMLRARRFTVIQGAMWEDGFFEDSEVTPRPEVDRISKNLEKITEDYRQNRLDVAFLPADSADQDTADTLNDAFRADAHISKSSHAWDNMFSEGLLGGMGATLLTSDYADPYDPDNDHQRINPGVMVPDADQSVYFDGASVLYDASDAKWAFLISAVSRTDFDARWGAENADSWPLSKWEWQWDWYQPDVVQLATYYEVHEADDRILIFTQEQSGEEQRFFKSEIADGVAADLKAKGWKQTSRSWKRKRVHQYVMNGNKVLKNCGYIAGDNIPLVPFYYRREWIDAQARIRGYVAKKIDPQRILNSSLARLMEIDSLAPFEVPIVLAEQLTPQIHQEWADGNIKRFPLRQLLAVRNEAGDIVASGPVGKVEPPQVPPTLTAQLQLSVQLLSDDDEQNEVPSNTSAEAIELVQNNVDSRSIIPLDNMALSMARIGEVWRGMARDLYYEPGRKIERRSLDGKVSHAELMEPTKTDDGVYKTRNDLTRGTYHVEASVQESTATKRQKAFRMAMEASKAFIEAQSPSDAVALLYDAMENMDGIDGDTRDYFRQKALGSGIKKPTPEEAQQIAQAQQGKQPDPSQIALQAQAQKLGAEALQAQAGAAQKQADARLKSAQAEVLEQAPKVPQGLAEPPESPNPIEQADTLASAQLKTAQANKLDADVRHQRIRTGAQIAQEQHQREMDRRQQDLAERTQDHVESQPAGGAE